MIHWFWYKTDGSIGGDHTTQGGWDPGLDFNDAGSTDETVIAIRNTFMGETDFQAFISHDDGVSGQDWNMDAVNDILRNYCVSGGSLIAKPAYEVEFDSTQVAINEIVTKTPGNSVAVQLVGASVPDGTVVHGLPVRGGPAVVQNYPIVFTFTGGASNTVNVTAPAQGFTSYIYFKPVITAQTVYRQAAIQGWA